MADPEAQLQDFMQTRLISVQPQDDPKRRWPKP